MTAERCVGIDNMSALYDRLMHELRHCPQEDRVALLCSLSELSCAYAGAESSKRWAAYAAAEQAEEEERPVPPSFYYLQGPGGVQ